MTRTTKDKMLQILIEIKKHEPNHASIDNIRSSWSDAPGNDEVQDLLEIMEYELRYVKTSKSTGSDGNVIVQASLTAWGRQRLREETE